MKPLKNKTVFITGASSGIGNACAIHFAKLGASIIIAARRTERLNSLKHQLEDKYKVRCLTLELDVGVAIDVKEKISNLPPSFQTIDILINNAGLALARTPIQDGITDQWDTMIDTNIKGLLYVTHAILPGMLTRNSGHIINIGSIAGHECYPNGNVYAATKHAVHALSSSMRLDLIGSAIRITEIAPGAVQTEFSEVRFKDKNKADAFYNSFVPLQADDIADAIVYCATRPPHVDISLMTIMPTVQASANHLSTHSI